MNTRRMLLSFLMAIMFFAIGCAAKYPTDKQWSKYPPIWQQDKDKYLLQGNFKNIKAFLKIANKLKSGMDIDKVERLGFNTNISTGACDKIGWLESSNLVLQNINLTMLNIQDVVREKMQYEGIRCRAIDSKTRKDRIYFNNQDTYKKGIEMMVVLIFKNKKLIGVSLNKNPIREHKREKAFGKVITDILKFSVPVRPKL